jgi:hypothetical protein
VTYAQAEDGGIVLVAHAGSVGPAAAIGDNPLHVPTFSFSLARALSLSRALSLCRHWHLWIKIGFYDHLYLLPRLPLIQ